MAERFIPNGMEGGTESAGNGTIWQWAESYICAKGSAELVPWIGKPSILLGKLRHAIFKYGTVLKKRYHSRPANLIWHDGVGQRRTVVSFRHWTGTIRKRVPEIIDLRNGGGWGLLCWNETKVSHCARILALVNT
ncbi:hypothetical protein CDAR_212181 [Caerostris darwini]|uniref:Uncharacterized protein n=1 Tax=Caerostris darwini TaxID=1538125 RepID=A0AAV4NV07_9ARAC|nr:hypothetical protein CDAR_212181 [Caerostris darwini]